MQGQGLRLLLLWAVQAERIGGRQMYHIDKRCALCGAALSGRERKFCKDCREEARRQRCAAYIRKRKGEEKKTGTMLYKMPRVPVF